MQSINSSSNALGSLDVPVIDEGDVTRRYLDKVIEVIRSPELPISTYTAISLQEVDESGEHCFSS